jgi:hypothetical protein
MKSHLLYPNFFAFFLLMCGSVSLAQEKYLIRAPQILDAVNLGMSLENLEQSVGPVKGIGDSGDPRFLRFIEFSEHEKWDGAMFDMVNGKILGISLLLGSKPVTDLIQKSMTLASEIVSTLGADFKMMVSVNSRKQLVPVLLWNKGSQLIVMVGPSTPPSFVGRQVPKGDETLTLTLTNKNRPLTDVVRVLEANELERLLVEELLPSGILPKASTGLQR